MAIFTAHLRFKNSNPSSN